jgi:hypothetical protein
VFRPEANNTLCDQVSLIPKIAAEDTTLTVGNVDGGMTTFPVPSGMQIDIHVAGLHYNRMLGVFVSWGQALRKRCSAVLGATSQIHARTIPWRLAKGCVSSIQSRYISPVATL